jgi:hypothetical protein
MRTMKTKKLTVFYTPSFRELIAKYALGDLLALIERLERFIALVNSLCLLDSKEVFRNGEAPDAWRGILLTPLTKEFTAPRTNRCLAGTSRVEIRVSHELATELEKEQYQDPNRIKVNAQFYLGGKSLALSFGMAFLLSGQHVGTWFCPDERFF